MNSERQIRCIPARYAYGIVPHLMDQGYALKPPERLALSQNASSSGSDPLHKSVPDVSRVRFK